MLHSCPPAYVCLMIGNHGVKMVDQSELRKHKASSSNNQKKHGRLFSSSHKVAVEIIPLKTMPFEFWFQSIIHT